MCVFHEHRHAFQVHVPEFVLPFRRAGLDLEELLVVASEYLVACAQTKKFWPKRNTPNLDFKCSVNFLRGLDPSPINKG